jgi:cytochrome c oxidase subunit III
MLPIVSTRRPPGQSGLMVRFILTAAALYAAIGAAGWLLVRIFPAKEVAAEAMFPSVFWGSTLLLLAGSFSLQRSVRLVEREKQRPFRRSLIAALFFGTFFVALQSYGLYNLVRHQKPSEVQTGANAFLTLFATLHAMHFTLALLCLVWVTLSALADRFDHEYFWGVKICAWFWHALGIVWLVILMAFLIATR